MQITKTMEAARRNQEMRRVGELRRQAMRDPFVKAVLDCFPGAEITDVTLPDFQTPDA